jgi:CRISPR/Cas system-associated exonuclease Cas4 (RecB family)
MEEKQLTLITTELSMQVYDDVSDVLIEWTMDLLLKDTEWNLIIADIKTAASVRTQEHFEWAKQKIIYPTLFKQWYHQDIKAFEYRVMTKTSNPKLTVFRYEVEDDTTEQVLNVSKELRNSTESQQWEPTPYNHSCFYCKLKSQCTWYKAL